MTALASVLKYHRWMGILSCLSAKQWRPYGTYFNVVALIALARRNMELVTVGLFTAFIAIVLFWLAKVVVSHYHLHPRTTFSNNLTNGGLVFDYIFLQRESRLLGVSLILWLTGAGRTEMRLNFSGGCLVLWARFFIGWKSNDLRSARRGTERSLLNRFLPVSASPFFCCCLSIAGA